MKLFSKLLLLGFLGQGVVASTNWLGEAVYNKWHQTELERWLSDHEIPYPTPAERADLERLIRENWDTKIVSPYHAWDATQLQSYLRAKGDEAAASAEASKENLVDKVKTYWSETEERAEDAYNSVKEWIFDTWSESQLKAFADKHGIPVPQPRKHETLLAKIRANYEIVAQKVGATASYPGDWLYETWTESDLKEWLDSHGIPAPQPTNRDKMIASVRRNSRLASLKSQAAAASASQSAAAAVESLKDSIIESWDDNHIKNWAEKNGIHVPHGAKRAELLAIVRKHRAQLTDDTIARSAASAYGAATSKAQNEWARATEDAQLKAQEAFDAAVGLWSQGRLKAYLDARGVPIPQHGKKDELIALVRKHAHKAATGYTAWTFDTWTHDNLKKWLASTGDKQAKKIAQKADATRDELVSAARKQYSSASSARGTAFASATSSIAKATESAKAHAFETWSDSDLKAYLDSYGVSVPQGSTSNELRAFARRQATWFHYGTTTPQATLWAKIKENFYWAYNQIVLGAKRGSQAAQHEAAKARHRVEEAGTYATDRVYEEKEKAKHRIKEKVEL